MTEPNQVRPIMKIVNQVRELIIDAHNAGEQKGRKQVVDWVKEHSYAEATYTEDLHMTRSWLEVPHSLWQAKLKEWGIE